MKSNSCITERNIDKDICTFRKERNTFCPSLKNSNYVSDRSVCSSPSAVCFTHTHTHTHTRTHALFSIKWYSKNLSSLLDLAALEWKLNERMKTVRKCQVNMNKHLQPILLITISYETECSMRGISWEGLDFMYWELIGWWKVGVSFPWCHCWLFKHGDALLLNNLASIMSFFCVGFEIWSNMSSLLLYIFDSLVMFQTIHMTFISSVEQNKEEIWRIVLVNLFHVFAMNGN